MSQTLTANHAELNNPKVIRGWTMFDWANSSYSLVISAAIFPPYFLSVVPERIEIFGIKTTNSALYTFAITAAYIVMAALSP